MALHVSQVFPRASTRATLVLSEGMCQSDRNFQDVAWS